MLPILVLLFSASTSADSARPWRELADRAFACRMEGRLDEAESLYRQALAGLASSVGKEHRDYAVALNNLGRVRALRGDHASAQRFHEEALARLERALDTKEALVGKAAANLADVLLARKQFDRAVPLLERAIQAEDNPAQRAVHLERLAWAELKRKRVERALAAQQRALDLWRAAPPSWAASACAVDLAALYFHAGRFHEAAELFAAAVPELESRSDAADPRLAQALAVWEQALRRTSDFAGAAKVGARVMRIRVRSALRQ